MATQRSLSETGTDEALLKRLRQGDSDAWRTLADAFRPGLRDLAAAELPLEIAGRADASDIVQQSLAEASEQIAPFQGSSLRELYGWLAAILNHNVSDVVRDHLFAQRRTVRAECHLDDSSRMGAGWDAVCAADQTPPSKAAARNEDAQLLSTALDGLPPRQRDAVRMRHLEGRPLTDIAAELGCNAQAAAAVIARGLRNLRQALQNIDE
jgi:RNA polymerase sigma-70 factor (ECF subfamily)